MKEMETSVANVMRIKMEDLPKIQRGFDINSRRCVMLSRQVINEKADDKLIHLRDTAFKLLVQNTKEGQRKTRLM